MELNGDIGPQLTEALRLVQLRCVQVWRRLAVVELSDWLEGQCGQESGCIYR